METHFETRAALRKTICPPRNDNLIAFGSKFAKTVLWRTLGSEMESRSPAGCDQGFDPSQASKSEKTSPYLTTMCPPSDENLMAFDSRFANTCRMRAWSPLTARCMFLAKSSPISMPFWLHCTLNMSTRDSSSPTRSKSAHSRSTLPASICKRDGRFCQRLFPSRNFIESSGSLAMGTGVANQPLLHKSGPQKRLWDGYAGQIAKLDSNEHL